LNESPEWGIVIPEVVVFVIQPGLGIEVLAGQAFRLASMRPQRLAAENQLSTIHHPPTTMRFNEAAAISCGKRWTESRMDYAENPASMRPQRLAAENAFVQLGLDPEQELADC